MAISSGSALTKAIIVVGVALVLLIPLALLQNLVMERVQLREVAYGQVAQGWGGAQLLSGPVLALPVTARNDNGQIVTRQWYVLPEAVDITADIVVQDEQRAVGIYEVPVYVAKVRAVAEFDLAKQIAGLLERDSSAVVHGENARLLVPVDDPRGLRDVRVLDSEWTTGQLEPTTGFPTAALAAPLKGNLSAETGRKKITLSMQVAGTRSLLFLPLARTTRVAMNGNWPHPGFTRGFLPLERNVTDEGFKARWQLLDINRSFGGAWMAEEVSKETLNASLFGVDLVQPVDLYQRVERAVKYGALFISLSLLTLFLWERLAGRPLHPIQHAMTGLALSVFYLLLLALSEHVGYAIAYTIAATALCVLLGVYLAGAFRSRRAGISAGGLFAAVFALLYLLVSSESYALLTGSLALFALLAVAMWLTRSIDWYSQAEGK